MIRGDKKRVDDILEFAEKLARYVAKGYEEFKAEEGSGLAIERLIELVGEASGHLTDETKSQFPDIAWKDIAGMRVLLAHAYHRVDYEVVWEAATISIPELAEQLKKLLN